MSAPIRIQPGPILKVAAGVLALAGVALAAQTAVLETMSEESLRRGLESVYRQARDRMGSSASDETVSQLARDVSAAAVRQRGQNRGWMLRIAIAALFAGAALGLLAGRSSPTRSVAALGALLGAWVAYVDLDNATGRLDLANGIGGGLPVLVLATLGLVPLAALLCAAVSFKFAWTKGARA
jgi:hypothetical protein